MRVAIVIVTYNSGAEIGGCLDALQGIPDVEIIIVDNASSDNTRCEVERRNVRLLAHSHNAGFAGGVNAGVHATSAPLVLLLNPDAHLKQGLAALVRQFDDPRTGAAGGMLTGPDQLPQTGFMARNLPTPAALIFEILGINRLWARNPVNWHYRCLYLDQSAAARVEQPAGAFLMFSRSAFDKIGGFDERFYPVWFEDVDFCARLKAADFSVYYTPEAVANHTGGHAVGTLPVAVRERYWYGSLLEYASKYYHPLTFRMVCFAVLLGAVVRAVLGCVIRREGDGQAGGGRKVFVVYGAVARLAIGRMLRQGKRTGVV
jgi:GT2 family glycosyltransferase